LARNFGVPTSCSAPMADSFPSTESFSPQLLRGSCGVKEEDLIPPTTQNTPDPSGEGERGFRQLAGRADSDWDDRRADLLGEYVALDHPTCERVFTDVW